MSVRPTFMGFEASKSAIFANQKALDITGQNLANMSTEGYTRQRADQVSVSNEEYKSRICGSAYNHLGMGTSVEGISQVRDERMDTAFRNSYSDTSYYKKEHDMLYDIETIMSEIDGGVDGYGYGLIYGVKEMYNALASFQQDVNLDANATIFADSVKNICSILNRTSTELSEARESYIADFQEEVTDANTIINDISVLNKQIKDVMSGYSYSEQYGPNELIDKRNMLLDELSAFGKIEVKHQSDGTVDVTLNRHKCVEGVKTDRLVYQENRDGGVTLNWASDNQDVGLENGILKASLDVINGRGINATSSSDRTIRGFNYYQDVLDTFSVQLAEILNTSIPKEVDENGNALSYQKLVGETVFDKNGDSTVLTELKVSALNISISENFEKNPSSITKNIVQHRNNTVSNVTLGQLEETGDNQYIQELIAKIQDQEYTFNSVNEEFTGTLQEFVINYSSKLAYDVSSSNTKFEQCEKYSNELQNNRDSVTNVSETEETMNMLTFNKAFQAAAKMMTTMDEMLDVVINQIGALG